MWHHEKPDVSHLRIFGTISYIHIPKAERKKLESKSLKCYFVGYSLTQKAYRFWDPVSRRIKITETSYLMNSSTTFQIFHPIMKKPTLLKLY